MLKRGRDAHAFSQRVPSVVFEGDIDANVYLLFIYRPMENDEPNCFAERSKLSMFIVNFHVA